MGDQSGLYRLERLELGTDDLEKRRKCKPRRFGSDIDRIGYFR